LQISLTIRATPASGSTCFVPPQPPREARDVLAREVLHHGEVLRVAGPEVARAHDVRMFQARRDARLVGEHLAEVRALGQRRKDALHDDGLEDALETLLDGQEDLGHPTDGELAHEQVLPEILAGEHVLVVDVTRRRRADLFRSDVIGRGLDGGGTLAWCDVRVARRSSIARSPAGSLLSGRPAIRCSIGPPMPSRIVHHGDGIEYMRRGPLPPDHAIVTSLPDHSELPELDVDRWKQWFVDTVILACRAIADDAVAIFYQSDVKHDGRWIDKGHLVMTGADAAGSSLLWHKIVCRAPAGTVTFGRPSYTHMLCVSRALRIEPGTGTVDVLPRLGEMTWPRAMGMAACDAAAAFIADHTRCRVIVDPFCGKGSMLAAANARGLDAIGVEVFRRRAKHAERAP
jgi:hypothetical protein